MLVLWHVLRGSDAKMRPVSAVNAVSLMLRSKEGRMLGGKCCLVTCGLGYRMVCLKWFWCETDQDCKRWNKMEQDIEQDDLKQRASIPKGQRSTADDRCRGAVETLRDVALAYHPVPCTLQKFQVGNDHCHFDSGMF